MRYRIASRLAGADGCRAGWICIFRDGGALDSACFPSAEALLESLPRPEVLAIDVPIGLLERGSRECDGLARVRLAARKSSVFSAPLRPVLAAGSWEEACGLRDGIEGKRMSRQAWGIVPKIREVDAALRREPSRGAWVHEVHPELCFAAWNGRPMQHAKRKAEGRRDRLALVSHGFGAAAFADVRRRHPRRDAADDDILDAFAALWTAGRIQRGEAERLPAGPALDAQGLRMEIVF
jgi:predicted RNase H-like nuclease